MFELFVDEQNGWSILGWTMLNYLWIGGGIGLASAVGRALLRSSGANLRYAYSLSCLAVLTLLPIAIGMHLVASRPASSLANGEVTLGGEPQAFPLPAGTGTDPLTNLNPNPTTSTGDRVVESARRPADRLAVALQAVARSLPWLWFAGSSLLLALLGTGLIGTQRLRQHCQPIEAGRWPGLCRDLAWYLSMDRVVPLAVSDRLASPVLVGIFRPIILLPPAALSGWSVEQMEMVLLHELAHVRRWDNLVHLIQRIVEALLFYQPAIWLISRWVRQDREHCCDQVVVEATQRPRAYAETLASMAMPGISPRFAALAMTDAPLVARIKRILQVEDHSAGLSRKVLVILGLTLITPLLVLTLASSIPQAADSSVPTAPVADHLLEVDLETNIDGPILYRWNSGESLVYNVQFEALGFAERDLYQGTSTYRVLNSDDSRVTLEQTSMLFQTSRTIDDRPLPSFSRLRRSADRSPTIHHLNRLGPLVRSIQVDFSGHLLTSGGETELPYALGDLVQKVLVPFPEDGRQRWTTIKERTLRVIVDRNDRVFALSALEESTYTLGPRTSNLLPILLEWTLQFEGSADLSPVLGLEGRDQITFDPRLGIVQALESSATLRWQRDDESLEIPLTLSVRLAHNPASPEDKLRSRPTTE